MKRRVNEVTKNIGFMSKRNKMLAILTAASMSLGISTNALAKTENDNQIDVVTESTITNVNIDSVIDSLYQKQMDYLVPTLEKLNDFYLKEDTKDIIKNGYPRAYNVLSTDLKYDKKYDGFEYDYISKSDDKLDQINNNNILINELKIKPDGNGRDRETGIIKDANSTNGMGFRNKTDEDKRLIDNYSNIIGNRVIIDNNLIELVSAIKNGEYSDELLLNALESTYNKQMNYIYDTSLKLKLFYTSVDTKNIIKNGYESAYKAINKDMNAFPISYGTRDHSFINKDMFDMEMSVNDKINKYIELIKENESIIASLKIQSVGNGRDPDYGIIMDNNSSNSMGFRSKTDEDKQLINEYTQLLGEYDYTPYEVINLLTNVNSYVKNDNHKVIK